MKNTLKRTEAWKEHEMALEMARCGRHLKENTHRKPRTSDGLPRKRLYCAVT